MLFQPCGNTVGSSQLSFKKVFEQPMAIDLFFSIFEMTYPYLLVFIFVKKL